MKFAFELVYGYSLVRSDFGRPLTIEPVGPRMLYDFQPNPELAENFVAKQYINTGTSMYKPFSVHTAEPVRTEYSRKSQNHLEGAWPKEVYWQDPELATRFKRKVEKDDSFIALLPSQAAQMYKTINQNNVINIYENYFIPPKWELIPDPKPLSATVVSVMKDNWIVSRPAMKISWSPDDGRRVSAAFCDLVYQRPDIKANTYSYIYNLENPIEPEMALDAGVGLSCLEFHYKDPEMLAAGALSGQVLFFDIRESYTPVVCSDIYTSFRSPPSSVLWTNTKTGTEILTASPDGQIIWWDLRNISERVEDIILDFTGMGEPRLSHAVGVSALAYEPSIPTRYMVGTETGQVLSGNRKGRTLHEKFTATFKASYNTVKSLERNPGYLKNFITAGDYQVKIFSEDCKESPIIWTGTYECEVTGAGWSNSRYSSFFVTKMDGSIDVWDLLIDGNCPVISLSLGSCPIRSIRPHPIAPTVAVGDDEGKIYIIELSDHFRPLDKSDKLVLTSLYEREGKREKLIEGKMREMKLKAAKRASAALAPAEKEQVETQARENAMRIATDDFFYIVDMLSKGKKINKTQVYED